MAIPHTIQLQLIRERLKSKEGKAKIKEIETILEEIPSYNTGPYGKIRQWLREEARKASVKSKIKHQEWLGVKKEGDKQFVLVGCPNIGKSSLINKLSGLQTKIASYAFTTLKPIPGTVRINGALFQIVDLPGLLEGATEDVGSGRRLIGIVKTSDGILLMHDLTKPINEVEKISEELRKAKINKPTIVIGSKIDIAPKEHLEKLTKRFPNNPVIGLSNATGEGMERLKEELWKISNLIRVYPKNEKNPIIIERGATIKDFAEKIHKDFARKLKSARVTGKSSKFPNQQVELVHILEDEDIVELILKR